MKKNLLYILLLLASYLGYSQNEGDIIITELMTDPSGNEGNKEWFEVYNTTNQDIDMNGWIIEDESSSSKAHLITSSVIILANDYAVFSPTNDDTENGGITNVAYAYGFASSPDGSTIDPDDYPRLNNETSFDDGDTSDDETDGIRITLNDGTLIDEVIYNYGYGSMPINFPPQGTAEGFSVELILGAYDSAANDVDTNWVVATTAYGDSGMFGTPGYQTFDTPEEGDIIITEFMNDPIGNESKREWFEVYNTTNEAIDMEGWIIGDGSNSSLTHVIHSSVIVPANAYAVFSPTDDETENGGITNVAYAFGFDENGNELGSQDYPRMNNENSFDDGDTTDDEEDGYILMSADGTLIDQVIYNYGYGSMPINLPPQGTPEGYSMELIENAYDSAANDVATNWVVATTAYGDSGMFGTPGYQTFNAPEEGDIIITELMTDPTGNEGLTEWFEVYNTTDEAIDMEGWIIEDVSSSSKAHLITSSAIVPANSYAVFSPTEDETENSGITNVTYAYGFASSPDGSTINADDYPRLNNETSFDDGDTSDDETDGIRLTLNDGTLIDEVIYNYGYGSMPINLPPQGTAEGYSVELMENAYDSNANDEANNWVVATESYGDSGLFGTPGLAPTLAIDNFENLQVSIYPNPASTQISFLTKNNIEIKEVKIYNMLGQQVLQKVIGRNKTLSVSSLSRGMYIVEINSNDQKLTKRFIVK